MSQIERQELKRFRSFYRRYYEGDIAALSQAYPDERRSLHIDYKEIYKFDQDMAEKYLDHPDDMREIAEEALRTYDLPADVSLGQAHVRIHNLPDARNISIRSVRAADGYIGSMVAVPGIVRKTTEVRPKVAEAAFECQRCGTMTYILQFDSSLQEPRECQGCERQGPFQINHSQSEFVDSQELVLADNPENLEANETPDTVDVLVEDDIAGQLISGSSVMINGILRMEQNDNNPKIFDFHISAVSVEEMPGDHDQMVETPPQIETVEDYVNAASAVLADLPKDSHEEETKAKLITPLIEALGWNRFNNSTVRLEYSDTKTDKRPDYALFGPHSEFPDIVIEAKSVTSDLLHAENQLCDYIRIFSSDYGVLTNGEEFWIYSNRPESGAPQKLAELNTEELIDSDIIFNLKYKNYELE